jgi:prepilin-type N-terminal cleavage/methylation domain-containing protein
MHRDQRSRLHQMIRRAFTLVELLVVIAIIGILVSLLLPAVQSAREAGRRAQCLNQLKQLALGFHGHLDAFHWFPSGGWGYRWKGDPDRGFGIKQPGGWTYNVLPFVEEQTLHDLGKGQTFAAKQATFVKREQVQIRLFACPSRRAAETIPNYYNLTPNNMNLTDRWGFTDYAANSGDAEVNPANCEYGSNNFPNDYASGDGGFSNWGDTKIITGICFTRSTIGIAAIPDGTSHTYLVGEKYLNPDHYTTGIDSGDNEGFSSGWGNDTSRFAYQAPTPDYPGAPSNCKFGSAHVGIFHMALADGSVRGIDYLIDSTTHARLGNRRDGMVIDQSAY